MTWYQKIYGFFPFLYLLKKCVVISGAEVKAVSSYSNVCTGTRMRMRGEREQEKRKREFLKVAEQTFILVLTTQ